MSVFQYFIRFMILATLCIWAWNVSAHVGVDESIKMLSKQLNVEPDNPRLYLTRGELHRNHQHWQSAWDDYVRAQHLSPKHDPLQFDILFYMGRLKLESGFPAEAMPLLDQVLKKNNKHAPARLNRARTWLALGKPLLALDDMNNFINDTKTPTPGNYLERSAITLTAGIEYRDTALKGLDQGIARLGPLVTLIQSAIDIELSLQHYQQAIRRIEQLAPAIQAIPIWQEKRADILLLSGERASACQLYREIQTTLKHLPTHKRSTQAIIELAERLHKRLSTC